MPNAWLAMAVAGRTQHGGNDGYEDAPSERYLWDSTVPNHDAVAVGDRIVLWDKFTLLGASTVEAIETGSAVKILRKCPRCGKAAIKARIDLSPTFKCYKCQHVFDAPLEMEIQVTTYSSRHDRDWIDLGGGLSGPELRDLCFSPGSQLSIRSFRWVDFIQALVTKGYVGEARFLGDGDSAGPGGHVLAKVRVRVGQGEFRRHLIDQFRLTCAFSGAAPPSALQACHLYSYAEEGRHHEDGGLLLRSDIHTLFDIGLILVDPGTGHITVSDELAPYALYRQLHNTLPHVKLSARHLDWLGRHWSMHQARKPRLV